MLNELTSDASGMKGHSYANSQRYNEHCEAPAPKTYYASQNKSAINMRLVKFVLSCICWFHHQLLKKRKARQRLIWRALKIRIKNLHCCSELVDLLLKPF